MAPKFFLTVLTVIFCVYIVSSEEVNKNSDRSEFRKSLHKNCDDSYSLTCLKLDMVSWVENLNEKEDITLVSGVSIVKENSSANANTGDIVAELAREFPDDPNARLDAFLLKKIQGFFNSRSIKMNLWEATQSDEIGSARGKGGGGGGGGGKKGGGGGMGMMFGMAAMMKGMLMAIALKGIALIAGKALMTGMIALVLSAIIGLKSLSHGGGGHSTYEVVAKPVYTSSHTHSTAHEGWDGGYGGHGRSLVDSPLPLALQPGYKPPQ